MRVDAVVLKHGRVLEVDVHLTDYSQSPDYPQHVETPVALPDDAYHTLVAWLRRDSRYPGEPCDTCGRNAEKYLCKDHDWMAVFLA